MLKSGELLPGAETTPLRLNAAARLEIEDFLEEEHGLLTKRSKLSSTIQEQWSAGTNAFAVPTPQYNPLDEPSPLGLQLRKSPSLLDLIQMSLSQGTISKAGVTGSANSSTELKRESTGGGVLGINDKIKASNFPASLLKIGCWEYTSRYEGDLVAKCYFSKHKLVWEVLQGGLKSKIEIQWSDIMELQANCPDIGPSTLTVVLARQPLFFREINPQPRKHTLWQTTSDFTDGQASKYRKHILQCPQGLLSKHFEKLIQCDTRLNFLTQQPEIVFDSPYFESQTSLFERVNDSNDHNANNINKSGRGSTSSSFQDGQTSFASQSSIGNGITFYPQSLEVPSPCSGSGGSEIDSEGPNNWDQIKMPGIHPSISKSDFMSQVGHCISEQMNSGNPFFPGTGGLECQGILEDIAQCLLEDNQSTTTPDEKSLMTRVNSLYCLLQKDPATQITIETAGEEPDTGTPPQVEHARGSIEYKNNGVAEKAPRDDDADFSLGIG